MCLQRRWPHQNAPPLPEHPDDDANATGSNDDGSGSDAADAKTAKTAMKAGHVEAGIPWHVDGGPSICFMALTLEARTQLWTWGWAISDLASLNT